MEHLHNFITEIQSLPIVKEKYYGLEKGEKSKHIHHSELKEGQEYDHECERKSIPEYYTSSEYKKQVYDLANAALTELLLLSKQQQLNVIARLRNIKNRIKDIDYGVSAYTDNNEKDNFEEHEIHRQLTYSFPIINIPYGAPDKWFRGRLREFIRIKIQSIDFVKNSLAATIGMADSFRPYGQYQPPKIKDPYFIIECAGSGLLRISYQFNEQIKERKKFINNDNEATSRPPEQVQLRKLYNFHIAQELPFIDFVLFRCAVRELLLNVPNVEQLRTILKGVYDTSKRNIETYINTISPLQKFSGNRNDRTTPENLKGIVVEQDTKYLTFTSEFTTITHNEEFAESDMNVHSKFYLNRDLALHSEKIFQFLKNEVFQDDATVLSLPDEGNYIVSTIEEYFEPLLTKNFMTKRTFEVVKDLFYSYFSNNDIKDITPLKVMGRNKKRLAYTCGQIYKGLKPGSTIDYDFLMLIKNSFECYKDETISKKDVFGSNLYKYCTTKTK